MYLERLPNFQPYKYSYFLHQLDNNYSYLKFCLHVLQNSGCGKNVILIFTLDMTYAASKAVNADSK